METESKGQEKIQTAIGLRIDALTIFTDSIYFQKVHLLNPIRNNL